MINQMEMIFDVKKIGRKGEEAEQIAAKTRRNFFRVEQIIVVRKRVNCSVDNEYNHSNSNAVFF
jgi:hypothetical protein